MEPDGGASVLQPVLQWGDHGADRDGVNRSGPFWTVASWFVGGPDAKATCSDHVRVNPGEVLTGVIRLENQPLAGFEYSCQFEGLPQTLLKPPPMDELIWSMQTLEAYEQPSAQAIPYDLNASDEYPPDPLTTFYDIAISAGPNPLGPWVRADVLSIFGERSIIGADGTSVQLCYR